MKTVKRLKHPASYYEKIAIEYAHKSERFKSIQKDFENKKAEFNREMNEYFDEHELPSKIVIDSQFSDNGQYTITRVQKTSVQFSADKLEKVLGKNLSEHVIDKNYTVIDMFGLVAYLKEFGVDPKVFKTFISTTKSVNVAALERLDEVGKLKGVNIDDCFTVKEKEPYFTVKQSKGNGNDE